MAQRQHGGPSSGSMFTQVTAFGSREGLNWCSLSINGEGGASTAAGKGGGSHNGPP
jgi:hypothetical protein